MNIDALNGLKCHILGLGRSNIALCEYLYCKGACLTVSDKRMSKNEIKDVLQNKGIYNFKASDYGIFTDEEVIFRTPSVHPHTPFLIDARKKGRMVSSEAELFFKVAKGTTYGITGSDGKTTVTTLTYELLKKEYGEKRVFLGGNIGIPLITFADKLENDSITVCELSSFQLMESDISPNYCAITNISENHLDYHKDIFEYITAKCNIFLNGATRLSADDKTLDILRNYADISATSYNQATLQNGKITVDGVEMLEVGQIAVTGKYNILNFMTAISLTYPLIDKKNILSVAKEFKGVEHRNELVREIKGVSFYNSSIDSTPSRTLATLSGYDLKSVILICGGYDKNLDFTEFANMLGEKTAYFIIMGSNAKKIENALIRAGTPKGKIKECTDIENSVNAAVALASPGMNVILSPASASFDSYKNFEERGKVFKNIVNSI